MAKRINNTQRWTAFCNLWISVYASAVTDASRRISAQGHRETMARLGLEVAS